jgi:AraC family transcriptional activator of pyochelin receptor
MSHTIRREDPGAGALPASQGLWRRILAGHNGTLAEAFANIDRSPRVDRVLGHPTRDLLTARVCLTPEEGDGYWELTRIRNDLYVIRTDFAYRDSRFELVPGDGLVQFNFRMSGDLTYAVSRAEPLRFNRPSLHVWAQPPGVHMREWTAPNSRERMVAISVRPQFLVENFVHPHSSVPKRFEAFLSAPNSQIDYCLLPLTSQMIEVIGKLLDSPIDGLVSLLYTEALTLELLCTAVANFGTLAERRCGVHTEQQLRSLSAARALLMKEFAPAPTLKKIGRSVGLAEKALTRGFKAVYGETVLDFSRKCRMQHAMKLLRDLGWSVDRVSESAGYAHPTSFTAAFRRHFGIRPIDVKARI